LGDNATNTLHVYGVNEYMGPLDVIAAGPPELLENPGDIVHNPAGLIFEIDIDYQPGETQDVPGIMLEKTVYAGHDGCAGCPGDDVVVGAIGDAITYCFTVTNTGETYLNNITITDGDLGIPPVVLTPGALNTDPLAPLDSNCYYYQTYIDVDLLNCATVVGNPCEENGDDITELENVTDRDCAAVGVCEPCEPCEFQCGTAYAYGGREYATCFIDIVGLGNNNWGWSIGPLVPETYVFPIYAGAGQCDLGKGTLVGTLTVVYDGSIATVTYNMNPGCTMDETHLYVGSEMLPRIGGDGDFTNAPGQFPLGGTTGDPYVITGLSGNIYVVAHADVCCDTPQ